MFDFVGLGVHWGLGSGIWGRGSLGKYKTHRALGLWGLGVINKFSKLAPKKGKETLKDTTKIRTCGALSSHWSDDFRSEQLLST